MSRYLSILILFMLFPITLISNEKPEAGHNVVVEYFFEPGCHECELIKKFVMPDWKENYSGVSKIKEYDIGVKKNFIVLAGHHSFNTGKCYGCTAYVDVNGEARAKVPRQSKHFRDTFDLRTEVERYFSRLGPREVEDTTLCNYRSVRNQMTIAHLTLNLVAVAAAIVLQQPDKIRCYKTFAFFRVGLIVCFK